MAAVLALSADVSERELLAWAQEELPPYQVSGVHMYIHVDKEVDCRACYRILRPAERANRSYHVHHLVKSRDRLDAVVRVCAVAYTPYLGTLDAFWIFALTSSL